MTNDRNAANPSADRAANVRIDARAHFTPLKFLDSAEKAEGRPHPLTPNLKSRSALFDVHRRIQLIDDTGVDMNVLVPVSWIEGFPKVYADKALAAEAAKVINDELAAVVAADPKRFIGVAILPSIDADAMVAELHRAVTQLGFAGAYVAVGPTAKLMDHPDYDHLYKALVELEVQSASAAAAVEHAILIAPATGRI